MKKITKTINNPKEWEYNGIDKTFKIRNAYGGYECLHNIETYDVVRNPYRSDDVIKITVTYYDEPYSSGDEISASGLTIKKVIFNDPATIVLWADGTKTVVKCSNEYDVFDEEKGLAMAICKKVMGNKGKYYETFKKWTNKSNKKSKALTQNEFEHVIKGLSLFM